MKNKSSKSGLFLMEMILSVLFFSLSSAVCVQLFVKSHLISQQSVDLNCAVEHCQNVAEAFYGCNGNLDDMMLLFESSHQDASDKSSYFLDEPPYTISVTVQEKDNMLICSIVAYKSSDIIYNLEVNLFPKKEVPYGN
ncbi:MAG: hypothetical protein K2H52_17875 [Lachnospiraceae bacterium]|nr:hypothetical protein [Lachnospiraceae bacterium]